VALGSDPYAVLGVARDATGARIAQARHQLVRRYHPDVNHDPDAVARFEAVQQAFELLSDPAARAEYDRTHDAQGRVRVMRAADGGYGPGGGTAAGILIEPASVNFGVLTPQRPWADVKVTVAWSGETWPGDVTHTVGGTWWRVMDCTHPASACLVFRLRAAAHSRGPKGQEHGQFTVTVNDTVLTAGLSAEFRGDFSAVTKPDFDQVAPARRGTRKGGLAGLGGVTFSAYVSGYILLGVTSAIHASPIADIVTAVAWLLGVGMSIRRVLRRRDARARDEARFLRATSVSRGGGRRG
jgi:hypothetical protein